MALRLKLEALPRSELHASQLLGAGHFMPGPFGQDRFWMMDGHRAEWMG